MKNTFLRRIAALLLILYILPVTPAMAWTDEAHMAVGLAAGYRNFQNCPSPDLSHAVAEINGLTQTDAQAHFLNFPADREITADDVYAQLEDLGKSREDCPDGYLFGAILHTVRLAKEKTQSGAYDEEYYAVLLHYLADISQPLHVSPFDDFNQKNHLACDDILADKEAQYPVFTAMMVAGSLTVDDELRFETEEELVDAVVTLAKQAQELAGTIRKEDRIITREEAVLQLSRSATLSKAVLRYCGKIA